ncbi:MAG: radical SAM family heme chaperone HemW [Chlorobiota bacterium]|nr:radical SAM family heme chaperone HemW [Chlorobiota bacterium]QQS66022.1 MAG: radical SAM family heme chaperone HemW [Chlorobiota bacterium]
MSGLYIHIPFCEHKCIYCNFYSIENLDTKNRFLNALHTEIDLRYESLIGNEFAPKKYDTIFFGGGTPSLLTPLEIGKIIYHLKEKFLVDELAEITIECNPGTLNESYLNGYKDAGINRLSFGVQSFDDEELKFLTRIHSAQQARDAITSAKKVFDNISLDLIFALPNQSLKKWKENLEEGVTLGTKHISAYSLIFEEGTPLNAMKLNKSVFPLDEDTDADMYSCTMETLNKYGFEQYEVSNYSKPGYHSKHNLKYWLRESYISFGPSAHSFLRGNNSGGKRWANYSNQTIYLNELEEQYRLPVASNELLSSQNIFEEFVMLSLRSVGINLKEFYSLTNSELKDIAPDSLNFVLNSNYATLTDSYLKLTPLGYHFADKLAFKLISEIESVTHL